MYPKKYITILGMGYSDKIAELVPTSQSFETSTDYIVTIQDSDPLPRYLQVFKGDQQVGLIYWVNLQTKQYRRVAMWSDIFNTPWDGGRIVRHFQHANVSHLYAGSIALQEQGIPFEFDGKGHLIANCSVPISQFPVVDYSSYHSSLDAYPPGCNCRTTPLTVEGTYDGPNDRIQLSPKADRDNLQFKEVRELFGL